MGAGPESPHWDSETSAFYLQGAALPSPSIPPLAGTSASLDLPTSDFSRLFCHLQATHWDFQNLLHQSLSLQLFKTLLGSQVSSPVPPSPATPSILSEARQPPQRSKVTSEGRGSVEVSLILGSAPGEGWEAARQSFNPLLSSSFFPE